MNLTLLMALVFVVSTALFLCAIYFFVVAPSANKTMRARLEAIQQASTLSSREAQTELLRRETLSHLPALDRLLFQFRPFVKLNPFLQQAAIRMTVGMLLTIILSLVLGVCLVGLMLNLPALVILLSAMGVASIPFIIIAIKRRRRLSAFEGQFPDALGLLARAVRAGHAFTTGLELIGAEMPEPVAGEFRHTFDQQNLGLPLRDALQNLLVRVPLSDVHVFVTALVIQRESGGNLAEILDNLSQVIRERFKLMRQIQVFTAQGRMSLYLLTALPPSIGVALYLMNRNYISRLFTDPLGQKMLLAAGGLLLFGYLVIRKIVQPKF
jgi:tight adherence protein B